VSTAGAVDEIRFRGQAAVRVSAGGLAATFLPDLGMTGVSLRCREREHLALPGGLQALRNGATLGIPLLAPWANRLAGRRYRAAGVDVDLGGRVLPTDGNGLPMHGLLVGQPGWRVARRATRGPTASFEATIGVDDPGFPFPHRIDVRVTARDETLRIETTVVPTGSRAVPIAFGWHPYLRLPGTPRPEWRLGLPARAHLLLDDRGIPTGAEQEEHEEAAPIGRRRFDDLYRLDSDRRLTLSTDESSISMVAGPGYEFAQVWVPAGRPFAALEPMTTRTNSLVDGSAPLVQPGDRYTAAFSLIVGGS
jgi:galactose mutarotase-like enzyme